MKKLLVLLTLIALALAAFSTGAQAGGKQTELNETRKSGGMRIFRTTVSI